MSQFLKSAPNHFDSLAHLVSSEEINHRQTGQQRQDQTQRLCTSRLHEADRLSERAKGYVVDHIIPLECGGSDTPSNMQWQTVQEAKIKDRTERKCRRE